jgi:ATP-dependent Clp protease ATP-binding subunit ClpB
LWLAEKGYDPVYGARPLKRVIQRELQDPLALRILHGEFHDGETVVVDDVNDKLVFSTDGQMARAA